MKNINRENEKKANCEKSVNEDTIMEVKLKMKDVLVINNSIELIIEDNQMTNVLLKFKLLGIIKNFEPYIKNYELIKNEKIIEYGRETGNGNYEIPKEDTVSIKKLNDDLAPMLNDEITFCFDMLKPEDIFNKGARAEYLIGLLPIISST